MQLGLKITDLDAEFSIPFMIKKVTILEPVS